MKLHYKKFGETGKPLLILHGLFGTLDNWVTLGRRFSENGFLVYAIDQRNHGHSPHHPVFSYESMAADVHELITELELASVSIIGHSMGGKTAMHVACTHAKAIEKLLVADIAPRAYRVHHQGIVETLLALPLQQIQTRNEADAWMQTRIPEVGVRQFLLKNLYRSESGFAWRFNLPVIAANLPEVGKALSWDMTFSGPTLFIRGGLSPYVLDEDLPLIRQHFPAAELSTIPKAGHWLHAEAPDAFFDEAMQFLGI